MIGTQYFTYEVYGLVIASEFELKELNPCPNPIKVDLTVKFADLGLLTEKKEQKFIFSDDRQVFILPPVGAFILDGTDTVLVEPNPIVSHELLALPLLGPVLAIFLHTRGRFLLHGSAVVNQGKAFGFVGDKGAGKSTLAAMLLKNQGVQLLTDDLLVLSDDLKVLRGYAQLKLSDEALAQSGQQLGSVRPPPIDKFPKNQLLLTMELPDMIVPIGGVFELVRGSNLAVETLSLADAMRVLLRFSYIARFHERELNEVEKAKLLSATARIATAGLVKRIIVPERISELDQVIESLR